MALREVGGRESESRVASAAAAPRDPRLATRAVDTPSPTRYFPPPRSGEETPPPSACRPHAAAHPGPGIAAVAGRLAAAAFGITGTR